MEKQVYASRPFVVGKSDPGRHAAAGQPVEETLTTVVSHEWVNPEYKYMVVRGSAKSLTAKPGQFFHILCPSPDAGDLWFRRPQSVYAVNRADGTIEFLYKCVGRGTFGLATLEPGEACNMVGPLGVGFSLDPAAKHIVVLGRGVGLATLAPISQLAGESDVKVTAILSARNSDYLLSREKFERIGADIVPVVDTDGSSSVGNVRAILERLIAEKRADAFYTCGSNRLFKLMKSLARKHGIPGQVAMEQVMACGLGPCYVCVKTFEVGGEKVLRRVCIEGPVFDMQEAMGW